MKYIDALHIPSERTETDYILDPGTMMMTSYDNTNAYPFKIFPFKHLKNIEFSQITVFCGGNGSGKSTLLNIIAEKLCINRSTPFNKTPFWNDYLSLCTVDLTFGSSAPSGSEFIASDDVFNTLLNRRRKNDMIAQKRAELESEYFKLTDPLLPPYQLSSLDDLDELKLHNEVRTKTRSHFLKNRLEKFEEVGRSNGEEAFKVFTDKIRENALYLLDEPENSLSPLLQKELISYLTDSVRFFGCQLVIATHSPFLLSLPGAVIYDLDEDPVRIRSWTELPTVRAYYDLFKARENEFR